MIHVAAPIPFRTFVVPTVYDEIDPSVTSVFVGYEKTECESPITVLTTETELTDAELSTVYGYEAT